jgi:transcriptional regulator with XRE-family HTH domain
MNPVWLAPASGQIQACGSLEVVFRSYRQASGLSQQHPADMLGYDRTYIAMIESGRKRITDRGTLARIARTLAIPRLCSGSQTHTTPMSRTPLLRRNGRQP